MSNEDELQKLHTELKQLKAENHDLQQQVRMRESERDLLAVMLNEAENAQRRAEDSSASPQLREALLGLRPVFSSLLEHTARLRTHDLAPNPLAFWGAVNEMETIAERSIQLIDKTLAPPKK